MITHKNISIFFIFLLLLLLLLNLYMAINIWCFLALIFLWIGINAFGSSRISSNYHVKAFCNNPLETEKKIALTFDDGPSTVYTEILLDGLKERGVKATFFLTGQEIQYSKKVVKRMSDEGHLIGNHT